MSVPPADRRRFTRPAAATLALLVGVLTVVFVGAGAANATASLGGLAWSPAKGNAQSLISVTTTGGCPAATKRIKAVVTGPGFDAAGQVVVPSTTAELSLTDSMVLPLQSTFVDWAQGAHIALQGKYTLAVICTNTFGTTNLGQYTSTMNWTTPGNSPKKVERAKYVVVDAVKPVKPATAPTVTASAPAGGSSPAASAPASSAPGSSNTPAASAPASDGAATITAPAAPAGSEVAASDSSSASGPSGSVLLLIGVLIVGAVLAAIAIARSRGLIGGTKS